MAAMGETYVCAREDGKYTHVYTRTENGFSRKLRNNEDYTDVEERADFSIINEQGSLLTLVEADYWPVGEYASDSDNISVTLTIINKETGVSISGGLTFIQHVRDYTDTELFPKYSCVTVQ